MFDRRRPRQPQLQLTNLSSLIAEGVEITGDLTFAGGLRIDGRVRGQLIGRGGDGDPAALLVLSDKGHIEGSVRCDHAVINGTIEGDLEVDQFVELQAGARVTGTIRYRQMQVDLGAVVQGRMERHDEGGSIGAVALPDRNKVVSLPTEATPAPRRATADAH
jgi:cytoskeletal protein CcmA (bactofilin family)